VSIRVNGQRLEHELVRRGWTGQDLARAAKVSPGTLSAALRGRRISNRSLLRIAIALTERAVVPEIEMLLDQQSA